MVGYVNTVMYFVSSKFNDFWLLPDDLPNVCY